MSRGSIITGLRAVVIIFLRGGRCFSVRACAGCVSHYYLRRVALWWNIIMLSAAIFFRDNHGVITPPSLIEQSDFLSVETVGRAGEAEGLGQRDQDVSQSKKHVLS